MSDLHRRALPVAIGMVLAGTALADGTKFSDFTPLTSSTNPPSIYEGTPITFGNPKFEQTTIIRRNSQLDDVKPNSGNFDMNTVNENGRRKGRYLFNPFETSTSGIQRHDLATGETETIWQVLPGDKAQRFDPSTWTPWGTLLTGEENWDCGGHVCGRLFELRNPLTAPGIYEPLDATSNDGADMVHQNIIPRTSHEGLQFDKWGNLYFVDENGAGCVYKYTPKNYWAVLRGWADYFAAGRVYALRVGDGNTPGATGSFSWVPLTDWWGNPLPGTVSVTDDNGVESMDARATGDVAEFKCTDYNRPEDAQIQTLWHGRQALYFSDTGTPAVFRIDLSSKVVTVFADQTTTDLATGLPVGGAFANPDNLAVDNDGNMYLVEDRNGGVDDDIWFAKDLNKDGDLNDPGEGIGRWATNGTAGSEFTGLYFDPFDDDRAWVNIQHPDSGNDRTIEITIKGHSYEHDNKDGEHPWFDGDYGFDHWGYHGGPKKIDFPHW